MTDFDLKLPRLGKLALSLLALLNCGGALAMSGLEDSTDFMFFAKEGFGATLPSNSSMTADNGEVYPVLTDQTLGSVRNSYAWSMAWFNNLLYVGTLRNQHCTMGYTGTDDASCALVNGKYPDATWRAEIWRYAPNATNKLNGTWSRVLQSPYINNATLLNFLAGVPTTTPRDIGYRMMTVCNAGDGVERLYVATAGVPANILYHNAGTNTFTATSTSGTYSTLQNLQNNTFDLSYRALTCFKGRLWASPTGSATDPDASLHPIVLMNPGPASGQAWQNVLNVQTAVPTKSWTANTLANPNNGGIFQMEAVGDYLYLSVGNRTAGEGLEIWRGNGKNCLPPWQGSCTMTWERVIDRGAGRPDDGYDEWGNPVVDNAGATLGVFGNDLYIGAGESGYYEATKPELLRINNANSDEDFTWELLVGWPRIGYKTGASAPNLGTKFICPNATTVNPTDVFADGKICYDRDGVTPIVCPTLFLKDLAKDDETNEDCLPTSRYGPAMGTVDGKITGTPTPYATGRVEYFWRFQEYKGEFFMGTLGGGNAIYAGPDQDASRPKDGSPTPQSYCPSRGWGGGGGNRGNGALLWNISADTGYQLLFSDGFGNPQNNGIRTFASMPFGLAIGTANYGYNDKIITGYKVYRTKDKDGNATTCPDDPTDPTTSICDANLLGDTSLPPDDLNYWDPKSYTILTSSQKEEFSCVRVYGDLRTDWAGYVVAGTNVIVGPNTIQESGRPTVIIGFPANGKSYSAANFKTQGCNAAYGDICGTATDTDAIFSVEISVYNRSTRRYLSGSSFNSTSQKWVKADIVKKDNSSPPLIYDWTYPLSLAAGTYDLWVRATDYAGNVTSPIPTIRFTVTR